MKYPWVENETPLEWMMDELWQARHTPDACHDLADWIALVEFLRALKRVHDVRELSMEVVSFCGRYGVRREDGRMWDGEKWTDRLKSVRPMGKWFAQWTLDFLTHPPESD